MITSNRHLAEGYPYRETALFSLLLWVFWASVVTAEGFLVPYLRENGYEDGILPARP